MARKTAAKSHRKSLDNKREAFCREYIKDLNATQAAIRAKYKEKTAGQSGYELLKKPEIHARIEELMAERAKNLKIDAHFVVENLLNVAARCQQVEPVYDREGNPTGEYQFDSVGANKALELLGKHLGMFVDRVKNEGDRLVMVIQGAPKP